MSLIDVRLLNEPEKALLLSNVLTIALALVFNWGLITLLWGYWIQSAIIGLFNFFKILFLGAKAAEESKIYLLGGIFLAFFFALHYGFFHFAYFMFLAPFSFSVVFGPVSIVNLFGVALMGIIFFCNHAYSFWRYIISEKRFSAKENLMQKAFSEPYSRIIPMHLTIIFGGFIFVSVATILPGQSLFWAEKVIIVFFLALKTFADLKGHDFIHREKTFPG